MLSKNGYYCQAEQGAVAIFSIFYQVHLNDDVGHSSTLADNPRINRLKLRQQYLLMHQMLNNSSTESGCPWELLAQPNFGPKKGGGNELIDCKPTNKKLY